MPKSIAPGIDINLAPSTFSIAGMVSNAIKKVSSCPVWKPASLADSSGTSRKINSAKCGVWRQWSWTAFIRQNSLSLCSIISQGPVPAISRLAASSPTLSDCFLLVTQLERPDGVLDIQVSNTTNSERGSPVSTSSVNSSTMVTFPSGRAHMASKSGRAACFSFLAHPSEYDQATSSAVISP